MQTNKISTFRYISGTCIVAGLQKGGLTFLDTF